MYSNGHESLKNAAVKTAEYHHTGTRGAIEQERGEILTFTNFFNAFFKICHHSIPCILDKMKVYISAEKNRNENRIFPIEHNFQGHSSTYF